MRKFELISPFEKREELLPKRATNGSAGYDISALLTVEIAPNEIKLIPTGLKVKMPSNEILVIVARSSLPLKKRLVLANSVGIIDADYYNNESNEGHIFVQLFNIGSQVETIIEGEKFAQGIFLNYLKTSDDEVNQKRTGGFGSTL